jgi:UPF0716 family protein affecting phage T7 exclusion
MRTGLAYTSARILLFVAATGLLYLAGARGILLLALAVLVSALASYILLSKQRDAMAGALQRRLSRVTDKATEFRSRLEEGTSSEDEAENQDENENAPAVTPPTP